MNSFYRPAILIVNYDLGALGAARSLNIPMAKLFLPLIRTAKPQTLSILALLWLVGFCPSQVCGQSDDQVFAPPPGILTRPLERAKNALANEDFATAVESVAVLLGLASSEEGPSEDFFLPTRRKFAVRSIRREASSLVADMPSRGRAVFELKFGIAAEKRLSQAIQDNNTAQLMSVARKYFHTRAGYVATYLLGKEKLFQGDFPFASRYLDKLVKIDAARAALDPELTILTSIASAGAGRQEPAVSLLMSLKDQNPNLQFVWGDNVVSYTIVDADSVAEFLNDLVSSFPRTSVASEESLEKEWLTSRSESNLSQGAHDTILPIPNWSVRSVVGTKLKNYQQIIEQRVQSKSHSFPASHAIALKNTVVFRAAKRVFAVDIETGKRTWMYPWSHQPSDQVSSDAESIDNKKIGHEIWLDSINNKLTSDGERVYFVESTDVVVGGRFPNTTLGGGPTILDPRNKLVALKVMDERGFGVEGQLAWSIDTHDDHPDFSGAVFLGAPLLKDQSAFVLYERSGQVRVAALDAASGELLWSQQIASTQSNDGFDQRLFRYRSSSTPVFADGLLICPTMVGGLVAIDLTDRSLKWGFKYDALNESRYIQGFDSPGSFTPWRDDALFLLDEFLCFSPVDSRDYYLIRLETGKTKLVRPKEDHWTIAGKFNDALVLVGPSALTLDPLNGFSGIKIEYGQFGEPVGTGLFSGKHFYLPFSNNQLLKFDLKERKIVDVTNTAFQLGNLSQYRGRLISRSATGLQAYWLKSAAIATSATSSNTGNTDAADLLVQAQVLESEQKNAEAIESLIRSVNLTQTTMSQAYLATLLVKQINEGQSIDWQLMQRGFGLLKSSEHRRSYLLAKIESLFAKDQGINAIDDLVALIELYGPDFDGNYDLIEIAPGYSVAGLRLVRSRLQKASTSLGDEKRTELVARLQSVYEKALDSGQLKTIRTYAELFGEFEFVALLSNELLAAIADSKRKGDLIWAHSILLASLRQASLRETEDKLEQLRLLQGMAQLKTKIYQADDDYSQELLRHALLSLRARIADLAPPKTDQKAADVIEQLNKEIVQTGKETKIEFPDGMTKIEVFQDADFDLLFVDAQERRHRSLQQRSQRLAPMNFRIEFDERGYFIVRDQTGKLVFQDDSRTRGSRHSNRRFDQSQYQVLGDLLILSCGYDHVAMDLSRIASLQPEQLSLDESDLLVGDSAEPQVAVLWRFNTFQPSKSRGTTRMRRESNSLGVVRKELFDSNGARVCKPGFLSSGGYCFLSGDTVFCLDPWSGDVCWKRSGFAAGSDLLADDHHVFVIAADDRKVEVIAKLDGATNGTLEVPANMINRFAHSGSSVFSLREDEDKVLIYGFDLRPDKVNLKWTHQLPKGSKADLVDQTTLAILTGEGHFQMVNLVTGKVQTEFPVDLSGIKLASVQVFEFGKQFLLVVNQNTYSVIESKKNENGGRSRPVNNVDGLLMLFDATGPVWTHPARMDNFDLVLNQPAKAPVFLFKRLNKKEQTTELIFVRRSDGSLIRYHSPVSHTGATTNVRYLIDRKCLTFNLGYHWLALNLTSHPRPPEPPAQTGRYASSSSESGKKASSPARDPFLEGNSDIFQTTSKSLREWVAECWKNNPMNPKRIYVDPAN